MATDSKLNSGGKTSAKRVLITGLNGFIGHHIADVILRKTDWFIVALSRIDSPSAKNRLAEIASGSNQFEDRVEFIYHDLRSPINEYLSHRLGDVNYILHLAAGANVDQSIQFPMEFVQDNVLGTCNLLDFARTLPALEIFLYFSTAEVFGPAAPGVAFKEWDRYKSSNPYAASKAGGEELAISYMNTYGLPVVITHTMNVFGERQPPERFIPKVINAVKAWQRIFIHSNADRTKAGTRFYIHARNVGAAILFLIEKHHTTGKVVGDKFNLVGEDEIDNLSLAEMIARVVGNPLKYELVDFHSSRPGHDLRYALDGSKLKEMGFEYPESFEESLKETVTWYINHDEWLGHESLKERLLKESETYDENSRQEDKKSG